MKFTLECDETEEKTFKLHFDGVRWALAMWELREHLTRRLKNGEDPVDCEKILSVMNDEMDCKGLSFEDIL